MQDLGVRNAFINYAAQNVLEGFCRTLSRVLYRGAQFSEKIRLTRPPDQPDRKWEKKRKKLQSWRKKMKVRFYFFSIYTLWRLFIAIALIPPIPNMPIYPFPFLTNCARKISHFL